ncbi:MAG: peptidoglycan bridge formation glycyltransferase FemA/FemB family protein [Bacilli bacterium]
MNIRELSIEEFKSFSQVHPLGNIYQTIEYGKLKSEHGFEYDLIGYCENDTILAASLILYKKINNFYYGYAPKGFLIDYNNSFFLENFTKQLKEYYSERNFAFIKINPEIAVGELNKETKNIEYNDNFIIIDNLRKCGFKKLKNNLYFESLLPRFNAILSLNNLSLNNFTKNTRNKVLKGVRKGLTLEHADKYGINELYPLIKNKTNKDEFYYKDEFNIFNSNDSIDLFLVSIDYNKYLLNSQNKYNEELSINAKLNEKIVIKNDTSSINRKMNSDKALLSYKNDIAESTKFMNKQDKTYIAGALVMKYNNRITFEITGFDNNYKRFSPNYFLYFAILAYYRNNFKYADLFGISGDFTKDSPYKGLNDFKLGFNPKIYEFIGEFDLPINTKAYEFLIKSGALAKEFNKK